MSVLRLDGLRPDYRRLLGRPDPLALYRALYGGKRYGFLYESLEERGSRGRFSFLGGRPLAIFRARGEQIRVDHDGKSREFRGDPLQALREFVRCGADALPVATFPGGAVGYAGYDLVRNMAPVGPSRQDAGALPDAYFVIPREVLVIDHLDEVVHVLLYQVPDGRRRLEAIAAALAGASTPDDSPAGALAPAAIPIRSNMTREQYAAAVCRAQRFIREGDIFQVVLSQRFEFPSRGTPLGLYAALRRANPSPYMYHLELDGLRISGSSPEILVKLTGRRVVTRPLAGTRPRGASPEEDRTLARDLLGDAKERAEHVMLVDLARNDIGRVCRTGSVRVDQSFRIERYSRVMHLVSNVTGRLRDDRDAFDLLRATFPAGTVSGAPKVRAMQIIDELEPQDRGPYAGAIGYFSFLGDMDMCIAIRTVVVHEGRCYLQAGAGIVADSIPQREYEETLNKARGVLRAVSSDSSLSPIPR